MTLKIMAQKSHLFVMHQGTSSYSTKCLTKGLRMHAMWKWTLGVEDVMIDAVMLLSRECNRRIFKLN